MLIASFSRLLRASWPIVSYMAYAGAYTFIQRFNLFPDYKITKSDPPNEVVLEALFRCLQLQLMHSLIEFCVGDNSHLVVPGNGIRMIQMVLGMVAVVTYQYFIHRFLHAVPFLYRSMHKAHHRYMEPFAFSGLYNSFSEALLADAGCIIFATAVCSMRASESTLLATIASAKTVSSHSGYMLPWDPFTYFSNNAVYHRYHHLAPVSKPVAFQQPFFTFWDRLLGTFPDSTDATSTTTTTRSPRMMLWSNFERIVCINLKERPDRLEHAKAQFSKVGILDRVQFHVTEKSSKGGCYGCFESHWQILKQAYEDGLNNVVIFEDDIVFRSGWEQAMHDCNAFCNDEPDWEFLNLNGFVFFVVEESTSCRNIVNGKSARSHAICLSGKGMQSFLKRFPSPTDVGVDDAYMACLSQTFVHKNYKAIVQLEDLGTDNPWCFFDTVKGMDDQYKAFIQNVYMPAVSRALSHVNLQLAFLPWRLRPWLLSQCFSENLIAKIRVFRKGRGEEEFPWRVSFLGTILVTCIGLAVALSIRLPAEIGRLRMIWFLLQI